LIRFDSITKSFDGGNTFALHELDLEVVQGETLVLLGSSGSGKSTLLRLVNRLIQPSSGRVLLDGRDVATEDPVALRRRIGYVIQAVGLFPHLSAAHNIAMIPRLPGWPVARQRERADELLTLVGLDPALHRDRLPRELSGGQQQRVGVARALAADPQYLLMDEPFGALDAITRDALQQELRDLKARLEKTVLFVTHDLFEALALGDRIAILHAGRLEQVDTPANILKQPRTEFVRDLFAKPARQLGLLREHSGHD
jgi:osmoprotectant transport system ATP-binding protein